MNNDGHINEQSKDQSLNEFREHPEHKELTTNEGVAIPHTDDSLKAGERGPTLMEDFHFREKITHFDHERIPERVVHARGNAAHGYFQVYEPMAEYTKASFLQDPSVKTPIFVRFSTVAGSRGSADTVRDVRGFATKFYTSDGIFDLVGNNIPIFFIQDAIKFPDLVHAIKPEPHNEIPQAATAHDTAWDFFSLVPESTHMIMWLLSDRALPRSQRMMEGFGIHTFRFVNDKGQSRFIKFHWKPLLGMHSLTWDESQKLAGQNPDWLRQDLWEAIEHGDYPEYEFGVQMIEESDEFAFPFDILDATKIWPEELVPMRRIGKMTLNRNPDNYFAETEQVAFPTGNLVPGIDVSDDPLLQGRLFSYLDTQLIRLGGPNFAELPINRPINDVHNNQRDGYMRYTINTNRTSYYPNSLGGGYPQVAPPNDHGYTHYPEHVEGRKIRGRSELFRDYFSQATLFWRSLSLAEQQHLIEAAHFELGKVESREVRERMVGLFNQVDYDLAVQVAEGIGIPAPTSKATPQFVPPSGKRSVDRSPALSMENTAKNTIKSRKVAILAENGVNRNELQAVKKGLEERGAQVHVIAHNWGTIKGDRGQQLPVDKSATTVSSVMYDAVFIPGGQQSVAALREEGNALHFIAEAFKHGKAMGAADEAIELLRQAALPNQIIAAISNNTNGVSEVQGVVMVRNQADLNTFISKFAEAIAQHRHWARTMRERVPA